MLEIRLLGTPEVMLAGRPITVDTRKAIALLAYLAVEGTTTRDTLAMLFWGDSSQERARATLRRTLSALRSAVGPSFLESNRSSISLVGDYASDVGEMKRELETDTDHGHDAGDVCPRCIPPLQRATGLYRGEFLEGFSVKASPDFDDWVRRTTESLRLRVGEAFHRLGTALAANGEYSAAITAVSQWIDLDPLHEPAHRFLMLLHAWAGDRPGAIEAYREAVSVLDQELGVPPLEETTELYEAILDEDLPPAPGVRKRIKAAATPKPDAQEELIDREEELGDLRTALDSSASTGQVVAITGGAWMGKTRLVEELVRDAERQGRTALIGRAFAMEQPLPFGLVSQVLRSGLPLVQADQTAIPQWALEEVGRLLPEIAAGSYEGAADRFGELRLFEAIQTVLSTLAAAQALVVVLDDVHWADAPSAAAFSYVARRVSDAPILMVVSARSGIAMPAAMAEVVANAHRSIQLAPLTIEQVTDLIRDETRAERVLERTGGVPHLVKETISAVDADEAETPGILRYLESRLREIGDLGRQILTTAAVLDGTCDARLLRETSGRSEEEVVEAVEELVSAGLLREWPESDALGFTLDTLEGVVYESTSAVRRRLLHRRAASALRERSHAATDARLAAAIAGHHRAAGDPEAATWYQTAGDLAKAIYAHESATEFYETALALGNPRVAAIRLAIGEVAMIAGDYERARQELTIAASQADPSVIGAIEHRIGEVERLLGRFRVAEEHFQRALNDDGETAEVLADWALLCHRTGDRDKAVELADRARTAAEEKADARQLSRVRNIQGVVTPHPDQALEHLEEALRLAGEDEVLRMAALNNQALLISESGKKDEATALVQEAIEIAERTGHRHREAALWNHLADLHHGSGQEEEARRALTRSVSLFAEIDAGDLEPELWLLARW